MAINSTGIMAVLYLTLYGINLVIAPFIFFGKPKGKLSRREILENEKKKEQNEKRKLRSRLFGADPDSSMVTGGIDFQNIEEIIVNDDRGDQIIDSFFLDNWNNVLENNGGIRHNIKWIVPVNNPHNFLNINTAY